MSLVSILCIAGIIACGWEWYDEFLAFIRDQEEKAIKREKEERIYQEEERPPHKFICKDFSCYDDNQYLATLKHVHGNHSFKLSEAIPRNWDVEDTEAAILRLFCENKISFHYDDDEHCTIYKIKNPYFR